jgi:hypothetical protein
MRSTSSLVLAALVAALTGCSAPEPVTHPEAMRFERGGLAIEHLGSIDRLTWFGPVNGPNMLFTQMLDQPPAEDGNYTFFGGCYTWVSPQTGPLGWRGTDGEQLPWPPDPAMDIGPAQTIGQTRAGITTRTPVSRAGLREVKTFALRKNGVAELTNELVNWGDEPRTVGTWVNTAVHDKGVIAVRFDPAHDDAAIWGWNQESIDRFLSILAPSDVKGWSLVRTADADWDGGGKVYLDDHPHFENTSWVSPEIAIWRRGYWLHRKGHAPVDGAKLRAMGEGPVAIYIQPASGDSKAIIEAELYGPIEEIGPGERTVAGEEWTLIESPTASVRTMLDGLRD